MTDYNDIKKKNDKDLVSFVNEKREEIRGFRFNVAGAGTRDVRAVRTAKKDVARGLTELRARLTASSAQAGKDQSKDANE